jgi:guanylate kinase
VIVDGKEVLTPGRIVLISGPSGCGKSTIIQRLISDERVEFSVSATTRAKREGEVEGVDYHFLSKEEFRAKVEGGAFIEYAEVYGNLYGTLRAPMESAIAEGRVFLIEIDVQGALQLRALDEPGVYVFIAPPSFDELKRRLIGRGTESPEVLERRLKKAEDEYLERVKYDHVVINDDLDRAVGEVRALAGLGERSA